VQRGYRLILVVYVLERRRSKRGLITPKHSP
jgi:hypothetical protein